MGFSERVILPWGLIGALHFINAPYKIAIALSLYSPQSKNPTPVSSPQTPASASGY